MTNGGPVQQNCALELCCDRVRAERALTKQFAHAGIEPAAAAQASKYVFDNYDLAERGTLAAFKESCIRHYQIADTTGDPDGSADPSR